MEALPRPLLLATRPCVRARRLWASGLGGGGVDPCRDISSSATTPFVEQTSAAQGARTGTSPPLSPISVALSPYDRRCSARLPLLAAANISRRNMSTKKDKNVASTIPGMIKGFGLRQKAPNTGNTALGKGFDLMEDDVGSRKKIVIAGYDPHGFQLGDGVDVRGSMICFPNSFVLWEPKRARDITMESLHLLELVTPKIDIAIIGVGERMTERLDPKLVKHLSSKRISVEQMDTVNACSTFNVLNAEDRRVAVALLQLSETKEET